MNIFFIKTITMLVSFSKISTDTKLRYKLLKLLWDMLNSFGVVDLTEIWEKCMKGFIYVFKNINFDIDHIYTDKFYAICVAILFVNYRVDNNLTIKIDIDDDYSIVTKNRYKYKGYVDHYPVYLIDNKTKCCYRALSKIEFKYILGEVFPWINTAYNVTKKKDIRITKPRLFVDYVFKISNSNLMLSKYSENVRFEIANIIDESPNNYTNTELVNEAVDIILEEYDQKIRDETIDIVMKFYGCV